MVKAIIYLLLKFSTLYYQRNTDIHKSTAKPVEATYCLRMRFNEIVPFELWLKKSCLVSVLKLSGSINGEPVFTVL